MAITSRPEKPAFRRYGNTQFRYAMTYVFITFVVLLFLNVYCSNISQELFYQNKQITMLEKCRLAADGISQLEVINDNGIQDVLTQLDNLSTTRLIVTDQTGMTIYDSQGTALNTYSLLPEIVAALDSRTYQFGSDVFSWQYHDGAMHSQAATPIVSYGSIVGCVYMMDYDIDEGLLIQSLQFNVLWVTIVLELIVLLFSLIFSNTFSRRLKRITNSMRIIQEGNYSHKVDLGGNDELSLLGDEFNDLTERLQNSEQKRRRFVSDASHELKTPLASIKLLSDSIMQNEMDNETIREFVGDIGNEAERLNRMTAKLLSLTKVDSLPEVENEIIYMSPTILRVEKMLSALAGNAGVTMHLYLDQDSPVLIMEDDLYQIVFNLMENGIKYTPRGGSLTVLLRREEDNAILQVRDTGVGIPEDAIAHIFERFYRVDKARSRQTGGSGLGLSIVKAIVERSRGEITCESTPGKGSVFTVTFPAFDTEVDQE